MVALADSGRLLLLVGTKTLLILAIRSVRPARAVRIELRDVGRTPLAQAHGSGLARERML